MSDIEREEFEQAVADKWSDSYKFTRFGDEDYYDEVLEGMWRGWQASRQALEGEPVGWIVHCPSGYKKRPHAVLRSDYNVEAPKFWSAASLRLTLPLLDSTPTLPAARL